MDAFQNELSSDEADAAGLREEQQEALYQEMLAKEATLDEKLQEQELAVATDGATLTEE